MGRTSGSSRLRGGYGWNPGPRARPGRPHSPALPARPTSHLVSSSRGPSSRCSRSKVAQRRSSCSRSCSSCAKSSCSCRFSCCSWSTCSWSSCWARSARWACAGPSSRSASRSRGQCRCRSSYAWGRKADLGPGGSPGLRPPHPCPPLPGHRLLLWRPMAALGDGRLHSTMRIIMTTLVTTTSRILETTSIIANTSAGIPRCQASF